MVARGAVKKACTYRDCPAEIGVRCACTICTLSFISAGYNFQCIDWAQVGLRVQAVGLIVACFSTYPSLFQEAESELRCAVMFEVQGPGFRVQMCGSRRQNPNSIRRRNGRNDRNASLTRGLVILHFRLVYLHARSCCFSFLKYFNAPNSF